MNRKTNECNKWLCLFDIFELTEFECLVKNVYIWSVPELRECKCFYYDNRFSLYYIEENCETSRFLQVLEQDIDRYINA